MAFLPRDAKRARARRKKAGDGRCGRMIEAKPLSGQTPSIRGRRGCATANGRDTMMRSGAYHTTRLTDGDITGTVKTLILSGWPDPIRRRELRSCS